MTSMRFIMVGGFLGAGKTTTLARLARFYMDRGQKRRPGHQRPGQDLVDTHSLRSQGFPVEEVPARASAAASTIWSARSDDSKPARAARRDPGRAGRQLHRPGRHRRAAAQGSVRRPLRGRPLSGAVQAEPRAEDPRATSRGAGFSPKAAYIFRKQLEEADAIVINRIDELTPPRSRSWPALVAAAIPRRAGVAHVGEDGPGLRRPDAVARSARRLRPQDPRHRLRHLRRGRGRAGLAQQQRPRHRPRRRSPWTSCCWTWWPGCRGAGRPRRRRWRISRRSACRKAPSAWPTW